MFKFPSDLPRPILKKAPKALMRYTTNMETFKDFQLSGYEVYTMIDAAARKHNGKAMHEHNSFLDFGCGAGRILQYIPEGSLRAGCDVNAPIVDFASQQFLSTDIYRNEFQPPLKWNADSFDMVYSFSVFSHLRLEDEKRWLKELRRVGHSGCLYLITIHGDWFIEATMPPAEQETYRQRGFVYRDVHQRTGSDMDFPEGYESSYHTSDYIRHEWGQDFEILEIYKGNSATGYEWPDMPDSMPDILAGLRPMGQDLVVMRKR